MDLRKGIDGLSMIISDKYGQNPFEKGILFCGKRSNRCKGLLWTGTGFLLLYKHFEDGHMPWPRTTQEAAEVTEEQFRHLILGFNPQLSFFDEADALYDKDARKAEEDKALPQKPRRKKAKG